MVLRYRAILFLFAPYLELVQIKIRSLSPAVRILSIVVIGTLHTLSSLAQSISGTVTNENNQPAIGAVVQLNEAYNAVTDIEGKYTFSKVKAGNYTLTVRSLGYKIYTQSIQVLDGKHQTLIIAIEPDVKQLNAVTITEKSNAENTREKGYAVEVIETKSLKNSTADLNQVLQSTPGINIRESGGLGSSFKLSLNGLSGNQIRYFIDGIPMENFGSALSLNNFPVNQIERLEVYKGVVPITLGADALGGAINIVSGYKKKSFLDASYTYGSFNTHKGSINGQYANMEHGYYAKLLSFFNHSDNNYEMDEVPVYDLELGNKLDPITTQRFNDEYTSGMITGEFGLLDKTFADEWSIKITHAQNRKNYQHTNNNILRPMGDFHSRNTSTLISTAYKKTLGKLGITAYVLGGNIQEDVIDTSRYKYNWAGDRVLREEDDPKGELFERRSLFQLTDKVLRSQVQANYQLDTMQVIAMSIAGNYLERKGKDKVDDLRRSFSTPNTLNKTTLGVSYTVKSKRDLWEATAFAKHYIYGGSITTQDYENNDVTTTPSLSKTGYGFTLSYKPIPWITFKTSYEKAYRLPETYELLGDGIYVSPNADLVPESSDNFNLGARLSQYLPKFDLQQEIKGFYRKSTDFIRFQPLGPFGSYENLNNVSTIGVEASFVVRYNKWLEAQVNGSYQNLTDQTEFDEGLPNSNYESRIPNIPYLFGNTRLGVKPFRKGKHQAFGLYWNTRYIHEFYLTWENAGNKKDKNIIPQQLTHALEIEYAWQDGRYNASFTISNLTNELVYDNFNIQKPGRAYYLKLRYFLTK